MLSMREYICKKQRIFEVIMISSILKKVRFQKMMKQSEKQDSKNGKEDEQTENVIKGNLEEDIGTLRSILGDSSDLIIRKFIFGKHIEAAIIYIDGLIDKTLVNENIMKPLMYINNLESGELPKSIDIDYVKSELLFVGSIDGKNSINEIVFKIVSGDTIFLMDGEKEALVISLLGWKTRGIEEPKTESVVRGPREGFTETMRFNTAMLRRKIKNPDLRFETLTIGERTKTDVCIAYIKGLTDPKLIEEIRQRLMRIKTDAILESGYIEQYIEDSPFSIFPTIANSEKPDKVAAKMLEGRAAILVDGTPFVLTVPMLFIESFQSSEDYYSRPYFSSMIRILRVIAFFLSILAPAAYVALSTFHQELIPTPLLLSMAAAHEGVPFPSAVEAGVMLVFFEILREAGVRLPRPIGQAVSIVGALVIGESAVSAGIIGAPMVIVVAITAVSSFAVPPQTDSGAIIRFVLLILAGFMGGFGIAIGLFALFIHMAKLRSFGTPYLLPLAPLDKSGLKDTLVRTSIWSLRKRPLGMSLDDIRQEGSLKPSLSKDDVNVPEGN